MNILEENKQYDVRENKVSEFSSLTTVLGRIYKALYDSGLQETEVRVNYWIYKENSQVILQVLDSYNIPYRVRRNEGEKNVRLRDYIITVGYNF